RAADGSFTGFDIDVARAYASDRGRTLELVPFAWPDLERRLLAGDFDVAMSGITVRGDRLAKAPMSATVARAAAVLVVPASHTRQMAGDGSGLAVGVNRGGHLEKVARSALPRARIVTVDDNLILGAVLAGAGPVQADAVVTDSLEVRSFSVPTRIVRV